MKRKAWLVMTYTCILDVSHMAFLFTSVYPLSRQARIDMLQQQVSQGGGALAEQIAAGNLNPFSNQVRPPTLAECEAIIKHLQKVNENQAHEVMHCEGSSQFMDEL